MTRITTAAALLSLVLLALPAASQAAVLAVTNTDDSGDGSLRDVVEAAVDGDTIVFSLPAGSVIALSGDHINIVSDIRVLGPGGRPPEEPSAEVDRARVPDRRLFDHGDDRSAD